MTYREDEVDVINPTTEMHFAIRSSYQGTHFPHTHDFFEIFLVLEGRQILQLNGININCVPGSLVLIRPNDVHSRKYLEEGKHINIAFSVRIVTLMLNYLGIGFPYKKIMETPYPPCVILNDPERDSMRKQLLDLYYLSLKDTSQQKTRLRIFIMKAFTEYFAKAIEFGESYSDWFEILTKEMAKPDILEEGMPAILKMCNMSHSYLCRAFKTRLGTTPTKYLNSLRLNTAANYLIHSDLEILDICMKVGFDNLSYFYRIFKQKYGMTPKQYREKYSMVNF